MFGDNRSVVTSSTIPNSTISKRHHLASYHRVREAIAAKYISFGKMAKATLLTSSANIGSLQLCGPCSSLSCSGGARLPPSKGSDRIPSTNPGAEPPRDARDSGSARLHSTHLETSSSDRPSMVTSMEPQTVPSYMSVKCARRTLCMTNFTCAPHAQPLLSNIPKWDSNFGEPTHSCGMNRLGQNFPTSPQNQNTKLTHCSIYMSIRLISFPQTK